MINWLPCCLYNNWSVHFNDSTTTLITKIGENGVIQWTKSYEKNILYFNTKNMIKTSDDFIVLGGWSDSGSCVVKINQNGDRIWLRNNIQLKGTLSYPKSQTMLLSISETRDKGFVFGGQYQSNTPFKQEAFIIKLDKYGCDKPGCHTQDKWYTDSVQKAEDSIANVNNKSNKGGNIILFPNPTHGEITVKIAVSYSFTKPITGKIYSSTGKILQSFQIKEYTTHYNLKELSAGVYVFGFSYGGIEELKKFIIY